MFEAVFQIGFYEIYCIVLGFVGSRSMAMVQTEGHFRTQELWEHSVITAVAASNLAKRVQTLEAVGFTAGLLHDIGKLVFVSVEGAAYANLLRDAAADGVKLVVAEEARFGFNHADLGAHLLAHWNLPENVCITVLHHHSASNPDEPNDRLPAIINLADILAHQLQDAPEKRVNYVASSETLDQLGIASADISLLLDQTRDSLHQVEALLEMTG